MLRQVCTLILVSHLIDVMPLIPGINFVNSKVRNLDFPFGGVIEF